MDFVAAIEQQNTQVAAGQIGQPPVDKGQVFQITVNTMGRLADPDQFAEMIVKTDDNGRLVRLKDVARIELGAQGYDQSCTLNGEPSVALSIYQLPGSNAPEITGLVKAKMLELKSRFPEGLDYAIVYDTMPFITESIGEVFKALRDAVILVAIVVLVFGRTWQVNVQADQSFREEVENLRQLKVRNDSGRMVPLGTFLTVREVMGPVLIARYNMYSSVPVNCSSAPGLSSGQAIERIEHVVNEELNWSMRSEWTELALLQLQTGNTAMLVLAVVLVFLVLAAQYESWALPLAVILVVPMCLLCAIAAAQWAKLGINIFTQVGFVVLIGLAAR